MFVEPGEHRIEVRLAGYLPVGETVRVAKGQATAAGPAMVLEKSDGQASSGAKMEGGTSASRAGAGAAVAEPPPAPVAVSAAAREELGGGKGGAGGDLQAGWALLRRNFRERATRSQAASPVAPSAAARCGGRRKAVLSIV
ncbi:hypothetical protein WME79_03200 [Sorangium sp. So ce726]|uniref:hypothetical protein n=1 Tax=Sorangium sp. So ce726 TaxID=3133319 RepID=UPI003F60DC6C